MRDRWAKFEIIARALGSIALALIPIVIAYYADSIKQTIERAKLVEEVIGELTDEQRRRDLALLALESAIPPERCVFFRLGCSGVDPDLVIEIAKVIYPKLASKDEFSVGLDIVRRRRPDKVAAFLTDRAPPTDEFKTDEFKKAATEFVASGLAPQPRRKELKDIRLVYVQYQADRRRAQQVQEILKAAGVSAPGFEHVNKKIMKNEIRYFQGQKIAAKTLQKYLHDQGVSIDDDGVVDLSEHYPNVPTGQFEIWLKD